MIISPEDSMVSVIIPCYNEQKHIFQTLSILESFLTSMSFPYELICVNDGSSDNTVEEISRYLNLQTEPKVKVISFTENTGKGEAIRRGLLSANGEYVIFIDADLPVDTSYIQNMVDMLKANADVVIADRREGNGASENASFVRRFISFCGYLLCRIVLGIKIRDTQAGFKGMKRNVALLLADKQTMKRFSFDIEYIYISGLNGLTIKQLPVVYKNDVNHSSVHVIRDVFRSVIDVFKIRCHKREYLKK